MASAAAAAVDAEAPSQLYRESARAIFSGLSAHFNDPRLSDLLLVRPDGRGIHSHQVVLASCSRKFAGVLASGEATGKELPIQGVDPSALETVIGFFYRGEILLTPYTVVPIYDVCLKLEVPGLSGGCEQYLSSNMSPATCPVFLESAVSLLLEPLVKRCLAYAKTRFEEVVGSPSFQSLSTEAMRLLLGHVRSSVDDIGLAKALARWAVQKQERLAECEALFKELKLTTSALLQLLQSPDLISSLGAPGPAPAAGATTGPGAAGGAGAGQGPGGPGPRGQDKGEQQQQHKQGSTASPGSGPGGAGGPARGPPNFERSSHPNPERPASGLPPALERASMPNILDRPSGPNLERSSLTLGGAEATGLASGGSGPAPAMFARVSGPRSPSLSGGTRPDKGGLAGDTEGGLDAGAGPGSIRGSNTGLAGTGPGLGWSASGVGGGPGAGQGAGGPPGRGGQLPSFARWSAPADSFRAGPGSGRDLGRGLDDHDNRMMRRPPPGRSPLRMAGIDLEGPGLDGGGGGTVAVPVAALEQAGLTVSMTPSGGLAASGGPLGSLQVPLQVQVQPGAGPNAPLMVALPSALAQQLHAALTDPASLRAASRGGGGGGGGGGFGGRGGGLDPLGPGIDVQEPGGLAAVPPRFGIGSGPGRGIPGGPELLGPPLGGLRGTLGPGPGRGARGGPPGGWGAGGSDAGLLALAAAGGAAGSLPGLGGPPLPNGSGGPGGGGGLGGPGGKRRRQSPEEADPDHIEEISTRGGRRGGGTPGSKAPLLCHVDDCQVDLSNLKEYHQRFRICDYHLKASTVLRDGIQQRFCQQCGRFHLLSEFDGTKRSCRARLQRHNARRRKRPEPREGEEPRRPQQRNPGFGGGQQLSGPLSLQGLYGSGLPNMARSSDPGVEALVSLRGGAPPGGLGGDMGLSLDPLPGQFRQQMDIQRELMRLQRGRAGQQPSRQEQLLRLQGYDLGGPDYGHGAGGMEGDDDDLGPDGDDGGPGDDGDEDDGMEGEDPLAPLPSQPPPPQQQQGRSNMPPLQLLQQLGLPLLAVKEEEGRQGGGTGPRGPQGAGQQQHEAQQQQPAAERPPSRGGAEGSRAGAEGRGGAGAGGGGSGAGGSGSGAAGGGSGGAVAVKLEPGSPGEAGAQAGPGEQAAMGAGGGGRSQPQPQPERERERERERDPAGGGGGRPRGEEPSAGGADSRTVTQSPGHGQEAGVEVEQGAPKGAAN